MKFDILRASTCKFLDATLSAKSQNHQLSSLLRKEMM